MLTAAINESLTDPRGAMVIYERLAAFAMSTTINQHDDSPKARQLRYIR